MNFRYPIVLVLAILMPVQAWAIANPVPPDTGVSAVVLDQPSPVEGDPGAFDRLFTQLDLGGLSAATPEQARAQLSQLSALLPANDISRDLRYRYLRCRLPPEDPVSGIDAATRGLAEARTLGDQHAQTQFLFCRAELRGYVDTPRESLQDWEAGLQLARANRDWRLVADGLIGRGHIRSLLGEHARALNDFLTAQQLYNSAGLAGLARNNVLNLGIAYRRMGEYDKALEFLAQAHADGLARDDWSARVIALLQQGFLFEQMDQPDKARSSYERVIELATKYGARLDLGPARLGLASVLLAQGHYAKALQDLEQAEEDFSLLKDASSRDMLHLHRGQALAGLGRHREALREFNASAAEMATSENDRYFALLLEQRAITLEALGDIGSALQDHKKFIVLQQRSLDEMAEQRSVAMRHQYDAARREMDTQRLKAETVLQQTELDALVKARHWQQIALALGAALVLVLIASILRQVMRARRLGVMVMTDELTRVANRRSVEIYGEQGMENAQNRNRPLTVLALDIDFFKKFNDTYGHHAGDRVLVRVASTCQGALRQADRLGRIGGEEFLVVMPDTAATVAAHVAERLRKHVEALDLSDIAKEMKVTISIGLAESHPSETGFKALMDRADQALYRAKANGRNRVEVDDGVLSEISKIG